MSREVEVLYPGEMIWTVGYHAAPVAGPCPHDCKHRGGTSVVAWGPDTRHYELWACDDACAGECRAWATGNPVDNRIYITGPWLHVPGGAVKFGEDS